MHLVTPRRVHRRGVLRRSIIERRQYFSDKLASFLGGQRQDVGK